MSATAAINPPRVTMLHVRDLRALLLRGMPQVVGNLHVQPRFGRPTQRRGQPERELGADSGMPMDHARQRDTGDAQALRELSHRQATIGAQYGVL